MMTKTLDEGFNCLVVGDVGDGGPRIGEMADILAQQLPRRVSDSSQVVLGKLVPG